MCSIFTYIYSFKIIYKHISGISYFSTFIVPWGSGLGLILGILCYISYKVTKWGRLSVMPKKTGPVSQQAWHDKDPSLLRGH